MAALHSFLPGSPIFSGRPAKGSFPITIPGLPDGIEVTAGSGDVTLISDGGKRLQGEAKLKHTKQGAMLEVDASDAAAGKYTGSAELVIADGQRRLSFPVEISVRDNPWLVLLLILVGILFGYAAKWVNERGSKIITAQNKIHEVEARREQLPPDFASWLEPTISDLIARFAIGRYDDVATLAGHADARIAFVERLVRLDDRANRIRRSHPEPWHPGKHERRRHGDRDGSDGRGNAQRGAGRQRQRATGQDELGPQIPSVEKINDEKCVDRAKTAVACAVRHRLAARLCRIRSHISQRCRTDLRRQSGDGLSECDPLGPER
jgi:hypothetical protein